jgi:hypothetical protein
MKTIYTAILVGILACLFVAGTAVATSGPPATGKGVEPLLVAGNPTCMEYSGSSDWSEIRIEEPFASGTYTSTDLLLTVTVTVTLTKEEDEAIAFDFVSAEISERNIPLVVVKARSDAHIYDYRVSPLNDPVGAIEPGDGDTGLYSVANSSPPPTYFGISHALFCYPVLPTAVKLTHFGETTTGVSPVSLLPVAGLLLLTLGVIIGPLVIGRHLRPDKHPA